MQHIEKNSQKMPKGVRLKWESVKNLKAVTVEKINIKGAKVFSGTSTGKTNAVAFESNNYLIP